MPDKQETDFDIDSLFDDDEDWYRQYTGTYGGPDEPGNEDLLGDYQSNLMEVNPKKRPEGVSLQGADEEIAALLELMGGGADYTSVTGETPTPEKPAGAEGEFAPEKPTGKQAFLKGISNFLAVFTAKDPGSALIGLINERQQAMQADEQRRFEIERQNAAHKQQLERDAYQASLDRAYLKEQGDIQLRNQSFMAEKGAEIQAEQRVIEDRFSRAMRNAGFNDARDVDTFRANLNGILAEYTEGLTRQTSGIAKREKIKQDMATLALSGAPMYVVKSFEKIALGSAAPEDYKNASKWRAIQEKMNSKQLLRMMQQQYFNAYLGIQSEASAGNISEAKAFYLLEGLDNSFRTLGFKGFPGAQDSLRQYGVNPVSGLDEFQQKVVAAAHKMMSEGRFDSYEQLVQAIQQSGQEEWGDMPEMKKNAVLAAIKPLFQKFDAMATQALNDRFERPKQPQQPGKPMNVTVPGINLY